MSIITYRGLDPIHEVIFRGCDPIRFEPRLGIELLEYEAVSLVERGLVGYPKNDSRELAGDEAAFQNPRRALLDFRLRLKRGQKIGSFMVEVIDNPKISAKRAAVSNDVPGQNAEADGE